MKDQYKTKQQLISELEELRQQLGKLTGADSEFNQAASHLRKPLIDQNTLLRILQNISSTLNIDTVLQAITDGGAELLATETAAIYLLEGDNLFLEATTPPLDPQMPEGLRKAIITDHPHILKAVSTRQLVILPDTKLESLSPAEESVVEMRQLRSLIYLPLQQDNLVIGVLILGTVNQPRNYSEEEIRLCEAISCQLSLGIQNARLHTQLRENAKNLENKITEINQAKEQVHLLATAMESAANAILITDRDGTIEWVNSAFTTLSGYSEDESLQKNPRRLLRSGVHDDIFYKNLWDTILAGRVWQGEMTNRRKDGTLYVEEQTITPVKNEMGQITRFIAIKKDITSRKKYERELEAVAKMSDALRFVNTRAEMIPILLDQLISTLNVDGAAFEILNPESGEMITELGRGVWASLTGDRIPPGAGLSSKVLENGQVYFNNHIDSNVNLYHPEAIGRCTAVAGLPMKVKENVIGALWVCCEKPFTDHDMHLFSVITDIAANFTHRVELLDNLQQTNTALVRAYDATIEGWARALELRDMETKGHCERVADLTLQVALKMSIKDDELVQIRRGALLHDIGKVAIPDSILHKPGALSAAEWKIMQKHPEYAKEWLSNIEFLRPALDIPIFHHEKWDGSGYPYGLKGEKIPLAARIFAIVDVWDALRSDRAYNKAWSVDKAMSYIKGQSGKHFDPKLVEAFIEYLGETSQ